jgi:hypothetical protein
MPASTASVTTSKRFSIFLRIFQSHTRPTLFEVRHASAGRHPPAVAFRGRPATRAGPRCPAADDGAERDKGRFLRPLGLR